MDGKSAAAAWLCLLEWTSCDPPRLAFVFLGLAAGGTRLYGHHRARRVAHDLFGHVSYDQPLDAGSPMRGEHDKIDPVRFGGVKDFFKGISAAHKIADSG